jgi:hypothetical protein
VQYGWPEIAFGQVVVGRDAAIRGPVVHALVVFAKDVLDPSNAEMVGGAASERRMHFPHFADGTWAREMMPPS